MRTFFFFMLGILSGAFSLSAQQTPVYKAWDKTFGGSLQENIYTMLPTADGGYLLGGESYSNKGGDKSENSRGISDFWITKIDADGKKIWDKTFGGPSFDYELRAMLPTSDGGYLLGGTSGSNKGVDKSENSKGDFDYWIIKIDADGKKIWDKTFGGTTDNHLYSMIPTADGGYLLGGWSKSNKGLDKSENSRGGADYWIIKIDANGKKLWDKTFGGDTRDELRTMLATADGGYLLGGFSASNKGGEKSEDSKGEYDYWVIKIDANGKKLWDKTFGGNASDDLSVMVHTPDKGYLLGGWSYSNKGGDKTGVYRGSCDYWIIKIDADGKKIWDKTFGGRTVDALYAILPTNDGGYLLGGLSSSSMGADKSENCKGEGDYWIIKISAEGNRFWDKTFGGYSADDLSTMLPTTDGGYVLGGYSESNKEVDKSENNKGKGDYWIVKIYPCNLQMNLTASDVLCAGDSTGSIKAHVKYGTPPFQFSLKGRDAQADSVFNDLAAGTYTLTVTDANGCQRWGITTIKNPEPYTVNVEVTPTNQGEKTGIILANVTGATPPYQCQLNDSAFTDNNQFEKLDQGIYTLRVRDSLGCDTILTVEVKMILGVEDESLTGVISLYPNPTSDAFYLNLPTGQEGILTVTDLTGKIVYQAQTPPQGGTIIVPTANRAEGLYIVKVGGKTGKVVIRR